MQRILTGDRTTGKLHIGHYVGSLKTRVELQDQYDTFIELADVQALTTHFENPGLIKSSILDVAMDNLSVGLDPNKITLFQQSRITSIAELTVFYSMVVSVNLLRRNPTTKSEAKAHNFGELSYGFLGYPVSQAADITFCNAALVPVGEDQLPHIELAREIVRKMNKLYSLDLVEPRAKLSVVSRLPGLDGNAKMGKSLGNALYLSDSKEEVEKKVRNAVTDTNRVKVSIPGDPKKCTVATYYKAFAPKEETENIFNLCRSAGIGCVNCKKNLANIMNNLLEPFREKRSYYENHIDEVKDIISTGSDKANAIGNENVEKIKDAMHIKI